MSVSDGLYKVTVARKKQNGSTRSSVLTRLYATFSVLIATVVEGKMRDRLPRELPSERH